MLLGGRRRRAALILGVVVVVAAGAISFGHGRAPETIVLGRSTSLPAGVKAQPGDSGAVVDAANRLIDVYTSGSSSCPTVPQSAEVVGESTVVVQLVKETTPGGVCSADLAFTTSTIRFPRDYSGTGEVTVTLNPQQGP